MPGFSSPITGPSLSWLNLSQGRKLILQGLLLAAWASGLASQASAQVSVAGPNTVRLGGTAQFSASVNRATVSPIWSVNGFVGGTGSTGPISSTGLYSPAPSIFAGHSVIITATIDGSSASLSVKIWNALPAFASGSVTQSATGNSFLLYVLGSGFVPTSQLQVAGAGVATIFISSGEMRSTITLPAGTTAVTVGVVNPNAGQTLPVIQTLPVQAIPTVSYTQAARLLDQTSFGPTLSAIQQVQQMGTVSYLNQQFATPATPMPAIPNPPVAACPPATYDCVQSSFWQTALTGSDQLRQRVAFALSEMFVVSTDMVNARSIPSYHNMLANDAFGNFSQLIHDVTLSAAMGQYLDMLNSGAAPAGQIADENFGRELMQLFTTGLYLMNPDGTPQLDTQGQPQPVYTQDQIEAYARALTGWTYANPTGGVPTSFPNGVPNFDQPMQPIEVSHDLSQKVLLDGVTLPAGQTAEADLAGLITSIFNHPSVGPFVCRQLIQHLVTSFPSPAYVERVAAVYADNGSGVRGDMKAVVTAILMDPEARAADTDATVDTGHMREPILFFTGILRGLQFTNVNPQASYYGASNYTAPLGQVPYKAASVFNFFPPSYVVPGTTINAPEFAQENTASVIARLTLTDSIVRNHLTSFNVDMSPVSFLGQIASATGNPATDAANLVNTLNILFMHDQMPAAMMSAIVANAALLPDIGQRVRVSTWLVISSNFYLIEH